MPSNYKKRLAIHKFLLSNAIISNGQDVIMHPNVMLRLKERFGEATLKKLGVSTGL